MPNEQLRIFSEEAGTLGLVSRECLQFFYTICLCI